MKKTLYALAFTTLFLGTVLMSCKSSTKEEKESQENVLEAKENVQDAKDSLAVAKKAATAEEWKVFKQQADSTISDNETRIAVLLPS